MEFVEIARFSSRLEAETIGHALDQHGIPFLVQSADTIFGTGVLASWSESSSLQVPSDRLDEVRELLTCVVQPLPEDVDGETFMEEEPEQAPSE